MFHILIVDDDRPGAYLLRELMKILRYPNELHFAWDGLEALDFLHRRGAYTDAPRPNLILLDVNLPALGGLETLSAIKHDPELYAIPVIMLSTSNSPDDVRESYYARANCYVQKPASLDRSEKLVQAVETFWMDFVLLPASDHRVPQARQLEAAKGVVDSSTGSTKFGSDSRTGLASAEATQRAMPRDSTDPGLLKRVRKSGCDEHNRLLDEFAAAVRELLILHEQQFLAIAQEDSECTRFDLLIHMANERKQRAKYGYLRHVEAHGCSTKADIRADIKQG